MYIYDVNDTKLFKKASQVCLSNPAVTSWVHEKQVANTKWTHCQLLT